MSKKTMILMSVLLWIVACAATARPFAENDAFKNDPPVEIIIESPTANHGPRVPALIPISGTIDDVLNAAILTFSQDCGTVSVEMVNLDDDSTLEEEVVGVGTVVIPHIFSSGYWTVSFTLENGAVYHGHFEIE